MNQVFVLHRFYSAGHHQVKAGTGQETTSHRQTRNRKQVGKVVVRDRRLVNLPGQRWEAMVRGKSGRYQVSNPGKSAGEADMRVKTLWQRVSGVRLHIYWLDWRWWAGESSRWGLLDWSGMWLSSRAGEEQSKLWHSTTNPHSDFLSPWLIPLIPLHCFPVKYRIDSKTLLITYKALHGLAPPYISELLHPYSTCRPLRSSNLVLLFTPCSLLKSKGDCTFAVRAPLLCNSLPSSIRSAESLNGFLKKTAAIVCIGFYYCNGWGETASLQSPSIRWWCVTIAVKQ